MRIQTAVLSTALASLMLATSTFAAETPAPQGQELRSGECHGGKEGKMFRRMEFMARRLDRAVENGRLTQAQADQFKAEARQLHDDLTAQRQASGGQLTDAQKDQFKQRRQTLREKVKAAMKATAPQGS